MAYYFSRILSGETFENAIERVKAALKTNGFGVLTDIDIKNTFKEKLDVDFRKYRILGACNPNFAHKALSAEDKIGVFLPCNVIVQELDNGSIEVAAVDPIASMISVKNDQLGEIAGGVQQLMKKTIESL
jgi:uncharacterized protein (DUF302 family)